MPSIPSIQVPDNAMYEARNSVNRPPTPKTPKSMLKNLFGWKKTTPVEESDLAMLPSLPGGARPLSSSSKQENPTLHRKPSFSQRSRSDNSVPQRSKTRSKSRHRSRSRCRAIWDPPPLFQAYNQAFMHDTLQIPTKGFLDWLPRNASNRSSFKPVDNGEEEKEEIESPATSHRRSLSDTSTLSLSRKLVFLLENGHILQYKVEGSQDRLPERVIELSRDSVAFASDAISGQHWVLEICPHGRAEEEVKANSSRSAWSRMTLKTQDTKRLAEKLLLVFESADTLFTWLIAIRKQIEGMGGIEYQPDAPPLPQLDTKRPVLRHATSEYFRRKNGTFSSLRTSPPPLPPKHTETPTHDKELPRLPAALSYQRSVSVRSTTASSDTTTTSLERLRESYSGSSTAGTALSSDVSATSLSPTKETFLPTIKPVLVRDLRSRVVTDRSLPRSPTSPLFISHQRSPTPDSISSPESDRAPAVPVKQYEDNQDRLCTQSQALLGLVPQLAMELGTATSSAETPLSILNSAAVPELRERLRQAQLNFRTNATNEKPKTESQEQQKGSRRHASKPSNASYGLFPKKISIDAKMEPLMFSDHKKIASLGQMQATDLPKISEPSMTPIASSFGENLLTRSKTSFKKPMPIALPHLLAPIEPEQPMRSPAVTDAMLDSNFGTVPNGAYTEPATPIEIHVPDFRDIKIDRSLFESVKEIENQNTSPTSSSKSKTVVPRRSMPSFHYSTDSLISAPVGPPPVGPLPAVPPVTDSQNSRNTTPSKRTSVQSSGNRRASTKSTVSHRHPRSAAQSFSVPSSQVPAALSMSAKLPQDVFQPLASSTPPKKERKSSTIGQVSVVAVPHDIMDLPHHKKSLSTVSNRSRKTHVRSASSISAHATLNNLPPLSHLMSPPCGFELDSEYDKRGCFGITTSRSST